MKCEITYLNLVDEALGGTLHPLRILDLSDHLMASPVVPTLTPYIDMLGTVVGAPLDLFHLVIGDRLGPLALDTSPTTVEGIMGPLPRLGVSSYLATSTSGSSTRAGVQILFPSSATLLGGEVPVALSSLIGAFTPATSRAGSSAIVSIVVVAAGCAMGSSVAAYPTVVCPPVTSSVGPEPKTALSEATLQSST